MGSVVALPGAILEIAGRRVVDAYKLPCGPGFIAITEDRLHWEVTPHSDAEPDIVLVLTREQRV